MRFLFLQVTIVAHLTHGTFTLLLGSLLECVSGCWAQSRRIRSFVTIIVVRTCIGLQVIFEVLVVWGMLVSLFIADIASSAFTDLSTSGTEHSLLTSGAIFRLDIASLVVVSIEATQTESSKRIGSYSVRITVMQFRTITKVSAIPTNSTIITSGTTRLSLQELLIAIWASQWLAHSSSAEG